MPTIGRQGLSRTGTILRRHNAANQPVQWYTLPPLFIPLARLQTTFTSRRLIKLDGSSRLDLAGDDDMFHFQIDDWEGYMEMPESGFIRRASVVRRVDALFRAMSSDYLLREQFITDPSQVLTEYVHGRRLDAEQASICNQLIYAFASKYSLRKWLHAYAFEHRDRIPSGERFARDLAHAVASHNGAHVVLALIRSTARANSLSFFDDNLLHYVLNLPVAHGLGLGSDGTGDTGTGTNTGTGTGTGTK